MRNNSGQLNKSARTTLTCFVAFFVVLSQLASVQIAQVGNGPDLVILNARIHTVESKKVRTGGIAIKDGRIIAVDHTYKIRDMMVRGTKRIDARERLVIPGFNDSHTHFMAIGNLFSSIDLKTSPNAAESVERIARYVKYLPAGRWILGGNWNSSTFSPETKPTKELIDPVTPETPVFIYASDPDTAFVNTAGLRLAGITKSTTAPAGGSIERDARGELTGIIKGNAILLVTAKVPKLATKELAAVAETASNYAAQLGVTSVQDMHSDYIAGVMRQLRSEGKLKTRVYDCTPLFDWRKVANAGIKRATGDEWVREGCMKTFAVAEKAGVDEIYADIKGADEAGLQIMVHSIGESANRLILDLAERLENENGKRDRRFRVEHAARFGNADLKRFGNLDVIPSMQPQLFGGYEPYRSLLKNKAKIAFGSDASITDFNPLLGVYAAVARGSGTERLTVAEAVRLYTFGSAYAEFQENEKGTIEKGKLADLVLLSDDIFSIPVESIPKVRVEMTLVGGEIVYDARNDR